jgi:hypothetical protein
MKIVIQNISKLTVIAMVMLLSAFDGPTDIFDNVANALKNNNAKEVANYFNSSVELNIDNSEGVYSKAQAEAVLKNFFSSHPCSGFTISHRGETGGNNSFAIGTYKSASGNYRVTIYVKDISGKQLIHDMKFEKE